MLWPKIFFGIFWAIGLFLLFKGIRKIIRDTSINIKGEECFGKVCNIYDDVVRIIKQENNYHLEFTRPEEYEDPYHWGSNKIIAIRFRNSGSYYDPFNVAFMSMFNSAQKLKERKRSYY